MAITLNPALLLTIALAPLVGALIAGFGGNIVGRRGAHSVTILGVALSFGLSAWVLFQVMHGASYHGTIYEWMQVQLPALNSAGQSQPSSPLLHFEVGFLIDSLSALMMCVVTSVSLMVHIYTIGYMRDDPGYARFFAYISLFTFAMLMLVMSNNFLQLFFGWEAVGLVSYLLIGFWYTRPTAVYANLKAFLVNRVGDFGFILGIALLGMQAGSLRYEDIFAQRDLLIPLTFPGTSVSFLTVACLCLFVGAMGKSAQFPLHVWLPDSMEGPTPISALIHAATMVTAGIFMVSRMSPLFELSETALSFMLVIGGITALFMGLLGIVQNDIKRVVAYSTLSQLGYMTVALGASAYSAALFHLVTHAFFKALLFLAAGSVIIGMHHEQDMRKMGGLSKYMPITWIVSLIGSLSLIGTPLFSGFYSKDSIIEAVLESHLPGAGFAAFALLASVFVTALYSFRMVFLVFHGTPRFKQDATHHPVAHDGHDHAHGGEPHESPWVITGPLVLLAIPSLALGAAIIGPLLYGDFFAHGVIFDRVLYMGTNHPVMHELGQAFHGWWPMAKHAFSGLPVFLAAAGVVTAWFLYLKQPGITAWLRQRCSWIYTLLDRQYYMNQLNEFVFVRGTVAFATGLWKEFDQAVIDGIVNSSARVIQCFGRTARVFQSGYLYHYALIMILGVLGLLSLFLWLAS